MLVLLDILRCVCCCGDDTDSDNNYPEIPTPNSSARSRFSNVNDSSSYKKNQSEATAVTPRLYYDHYPNYYKEKESTLEKSSQASYSAKTSSPLHPSNKPQSSPVFPKQSSHPAAPSFGKSTPSSHITSSGSTKSSLSSSPFSHYPNYYKEKESTLEKSSQASYNAKTSSPLHPSNKPQSSPVFPKQSSHPAAPSFGKSTPSSHITSSGSTKGSLSSSPFGTNSLLSPSCSPLSSALTQSSVDPLVSLSKLPTTPKPSKTFSLPSPTPTSFPKPPPGSNPTLQPASSSKTNVQEYILDVNSSLPLYLIPRDVEDQIKNDIVPQVLRNRLSPLTYKFYFAALLHAEDFYYKKWSEYKLENVSLELQQITIHKGTNKTTRFGGHEKVIKTFVAFEIDSVPERRPFLLSRDLVHARLCGRKLEPFQGFVYRITKSNGALGKKNVLLVDFGEDFYSRHHKTNKYDISFTFNRVCLKRAHQAIEEASDSLYQNFLFPKSTSRKLHSCIQVTHSGYQQLDLDQKNAVRQISLLHGSPPYLMRGPPCVLTYGWRENQTIEISKTGVAVKGAVFQIYSTSPNCKILICAPKNTTCDKLMISLKMVIPESYMFRATAAFRELGEVPCDILPLCDYNKDKECFTCPPLDELCKYKIIFCTFMSSFRLHAKGLAAGHFSHIFLLDASAAIEPEVLVPLTKFAVDDTNVIVTGETGNQPYWVRSMIARRCGLKISYFERLGEMMPYRNHNSSFISEVSKDNVESEGSFV